MLTTVGELRDRGVTVRSLTENFDLDTKEGRFMFAVLATAAEYELELRAERQAEGIAADNGPADEPHSVAAAASADAGGVGDDRCDTRTVRAN